MLFDAFPVSSGVITSFELSFQKSGIFSANFLEKVETLYATHLITCHCPFAATLSCNGASSVPCRSSCAALGSSTYSISAP